MYELNPAPEFFGKPFIMDYPQGTMIVLDENGEFMDAAHDLESLESVLYGDLEFRTGPRTIQVPLELEDEFRRIAWMIDLYADGYGLKEKDLVERVLV